MELKLRRKFRIAIIIWLVGGVLLALGAVYLTENLLILFILLALIVGGYCLSLKCPSCGKAVLHNPVKIFGSELYFWTAWIPTKCTKCGEKIE